MIGSPGSTLACPAYPSIALRAPVCLMSQLGSPESEFSLTGRRRDGVAAGRPPPAAVIREHAAAAAEVAAATSPRKARLEWGGRAFTPSTMPWRAPGRDGQMGGTAGA